MYDLTVKNWNLAKTVQKLTTCTPGLNKLLGIEFDIDVDKIFGLNFKQKCEQLKKTMKNLNHRNLTP